MLLGLSSQLLRHLSSVEYLFVNSFIPWSAAGRKTNYKHHSLLCLIKMHIMCSVCKMVKNTISDYSGMRGWPHCVSHSASTQLFTVSPFVVCDLQIIAVLRKGPLFTELSSKFILHKILLLLTDTFSYYFRHKESALISSKINPECQTLV